MAFDNIYNFVFYDLLQYDPSSSVLTGELQNDVIFGLMIPTIFIVLVLYTMVHRIFGEAHHFIGYLSSLTALGVIITLGWVPLIAGFGGFLFVALLAFYFINSFYRRVLPMGKERQLVQYANKAGKMVRDKIDITDPTITDKELKLKKAQLAQINRTYIELTSILDSLKKGYEQPRTSINTGGGDAGASRSINAGEGRELERAKADEIEKAVGLVMSIPHSMRKNVINECVKHDTELHDVLMKVVNA